MDIGSIRAITAYNAVSALKPGQRADGASVRGESLPNNPVSLGKLRDFYNNGYNEVYAIYGGGAYPLVEKDRALPVKPEEWLELVRRVFKVLPTPEAERLSNQLFKDTREQIETYRRYFENNPGIYIMVRNEEGKCYNSKPLEKEVCFSFDELI